MQRNKYVLETKKHDRRFADRGDVRRVVRVPAVKLDMETQISEEYLGGGDSLLEELPAAPAAAAGITTTLQKHGAGAKATSGPNNESRQNKEEFRTNKRGEKIKPFSIDRRRELAQKYTFKYEEPKEKSKDKIVKIIAKDEEIFMIQDDDACNENAKQQRTESRPVIKTVMQKGESITVYKAVSFEKKKSVPLRVSLPAKLRTPASLKSSRSSRKTGSCKSSDRFSKSSKSSKPGLNKCAKPEDKPASLMRSSPLRTTVSPTNSPKLSARLRTKDHSRRKRTSSPEATPSLIPLTEIAKWKPDTVNAHTKPYYEAWVNTTLSAISRNNDLKTLMEKRQIIKQFQQALENAPPVLTAADMCDERYAGRIRVHRRQKESS